MKKQNQQHISAWRLEIHTQPSSYLASLALDEEINPLVLIAQFTIQFILKGMESFGFIVATRYSFCLALSLGCADLY